VMPPAWWDSQRAAGGACAASSAEPPPRPPAPAPWVYSGASGGGAGALPPVPTVPKPPAALPSASSAAVAELQQQQQPLWERAQAATTSAFDAQLRRIAHACEKRGIDVRSAFHAFDANGDGFLSPPEFRHALTQLRLGLSDDELAWLLSRLDINADGMVSYEEFLTHLFRSAHDPSIARVGPAFVEHFATRDESARTMWQKVAQAFRDRGVPLRQVFALFDGDGDGVISREELFDAFKLMQLGLSEVDAEHLMRDIDVNEDGQVSIHEFANRLQ